MADGAARWQLGLAARASGANLGPYLHTGSSQSALNFYRKQGFVPFARAVETFADPRLAGILLPPDAAPQIPLLAPVRYTASVAASSAR